MTFSVGYAAQYCSTGLGLMSQVAQNSSQLHIDVSRIILAGTSAGANLVRIQPTLPQPFPTYTWLVAKVVT